MTGEGDRAFLRFYGIFFAFTALLACCFVLSPDDWNWAGADGLSWLRGGVPDYNGRYLGNLGAFALLRARWLLPLVKSAVLTGSLCALQKLTGNRDPRFLYLSALLLLLPGPLFIQDVVWTAAFINYQVPVCLLLWCAFLVLRAPVPKGGGKAALFYVAITVLGFSAQLFMEHYTLFALALSAFAAVYPRRKNGRFAPPSLLWLCAAAGGAATMFSNGAYRRIFRGEAGYQHLEWNLLVSLGRVLRSGLAACLPALVVIAALLAILLLRRRRAFAAILRSREAWFFLSLLAVAHAPLLFVFPVGARCFSLAGMLLLIMAQRLFARALPIPEQPRLPGRRVFALALAIVMAFDLAGYVTVFAGNRRKIAAVRAQAEAGNQVIVLRHTPLRFLVYELDAEDKSGKILRAFLRFNALPETLRIEYR